MGSRVLAIGAGLFLWAVAVGAFYGWFVGAETSALVRFMVGVGIGSGSVLMGVTLYTATRDWK